MNGGTLTRQFGAARHRWAIALLLWSIGLAVLCLVVLARPARADQGIGITPVSVDQTLDPGKSQEGSFQVLNQSDTAFDYTIYAAPYSVSSEEYDPDFTPIPGATDVTSWFKLTNTSGHLAAGGQAPVSYTIAIPANAKPGGYYAVLFAETESKVSGSGVTTRKRVGLVFYLRAAGDAVESGKVASWKVPWLQEKPLTAVLRLENDGSVHYQAEINVYVSDIFGRVKYQYKQTREVLPEKTRRVSIVWDHSPSFGLFKVTGNVKFLDQNHPLDEHYVLVASPLARIIMIIVLILILIAIILMIRRWIRGKKSRR